MVFVGLTEFNHFCLHFRYKRDSGGPLLQKFQDINTQIGLTSYGPAFCNSNKDPAVYTRVSSFIEWIEGVVQQDFKDLENETVKDTNGQVADTTE